MKRPETLLRTTRQIAAVCNVGHSVVALWIKDPKQSFPPKGKDGWSKAEVLEWFEEHERERAYANGDTPGSPKDQLIAEQIKLTVEKIGIAKLAAKKDELELAEMKGEMHTDEDVRAWAEEFVNITKKALAKLESRLKARISDQVTLRDCKKLIDEFKNDVADKCKEKCV